MLVDPSTVRTYYVKRYRGCGLEELITVQYRSSHIQSRETHLDRLALHRHEHLMMVIDSVHLQQGLLLSYCLINRGKDHEVHFNSGRKPIPDNINGDIDLGRMESLVCYDAPSMPTRLSRCSISC